MQRVCKLRMGLALMVAAFGWEVPAGAAERGKGAKPFFAFHFHELSPQGLALAGGSIDIDKDGDLDLLIVDSAPGALIGQGDQNTDPVPAFLFRNEGSSDEGSKVFVDKSKKHLKKVKAVLVSQIAVAIRDFNGDGRDDLYLGDSGPDNNPFPGAQSTLALGTRKKLKDVTRRNLPRYVEWTHGAAFGDVDGDGDIDIFERNFGCCDSCTPHGPQLLLNDGNAKFTEKADALPVEIRTGDCQSIAAALVDVDLDGDLDLVDGMTKDLYDSPAVLFNDGTGTFEFNESSFLPTRAPAFETTQIESADLDQDGWPDLLLSNFDIDPSDAFIQILTERRSATDSIRWRWPISTAMDGSILCCPTTAPKGSSVPDSCSTSEARS